MSMSLTVSKSSYPLSIKLWLYWARFNNPSQLVTMLSILELPESQGPLILSNVLQRQGLLQTGNISTIMMGLSLSQPPSLQPASQSVSWETMSTGLHSLQQTWTELRNKIHIQRGLGKAQFNYHNFNLVFIYF